MKIASKIHRARASRRHEVRKQVYEAYLASKTGKRLPSRNAVGDGQTKVWNFDPITNQSVLTYGDFDDQKFGLNVDGKVTINENDGSEVMEQHLESENIDVNVRRLDDTIVYTIDGKGNQLDNETQVEIPAESIEEDLRPDVPVIVNLRTEDGYSNAFAEVRPNGSIVVTCDPNTALEEDLPMTAATIKMDQDVTKKVWDTPNLHIEARADGSLLEFSVTGKNKGQLAIAEYTELNAGSLAEYTPKATGPTVMLRDDGDESNACVEFKQDGSVVLSVLSACTLDDSKPTTCTYLNIVEEGVVEQLVDGTNFVFMARLCDDLYTYSIKVKTAWTGSLASGANLAIAANLKEEFIPDKDVTIDYVSISGLYIVIYGKSDPSKGSVAFVNSSTSAITSIPQDLYFLEVPYMKVDTDVIEQNIENTDIELNIRAGDGEDIVFTAVGKGTTPSGGTTQIFPPDTVDQEFTPAIIDGSVIVPLTNDKASGQDTYLAIKYDGSIDLVAPSTPVKLDATVANAVTYIDIEDNSTIKEKLTGNSIELDIHKQGDVMVYSVEALAETFAAHEEFPVGTIDPEHRPSESLTIEIPCTQGSGAKHAFATINVDGSVSLTAGQFLETAIDCMGYCMDMESASVEVCKRTGVDLDITATKSEDTIIYTVNVKNPTVGQGTSIPEILSSNPLALEFCPDHAITCEIKTAGSGEDTAFLTINPNGTANLSTAGNTLDTATDNAAVTIVDDQQFVVEETKTNSTNGITLTAIREGEVVVYEAHGDGSTSIAVDSDGTTVFPALTFDPILFCAEEPISIDLRTGSNGWGSDANLVLEPDGSVKIYADTASVTPATVVNTTCRALTWDQSTFDEEEVGHTESARGPLDNHGISAGDWIKATFRKVRDAIASKVHFSSSGISADIPAIGTVGVNFRPDAGAFKIAINPDSSKPGGELRIGTDGAVDFHVNNSAQALISNGVRWFNSTFMKLGSGDIFNSSTNEIGRLPDVVVCHGEGRMFYIHGNVIIGTRRSFVPNAQVGGLMDIFSSAMSFVKSNIDLKAVGSTLLKAGGNIVTSLVQGKPLGETLTGAVKEIAAGGIAQVFRPDSPVGAVMRSGDGMFSGVMKMLPNGASSIIGKATQFVQDKMPMAATFINTAKKAIFGNYGPTYIKNILPRNTQVIEELVAIEAIRQEMTIVYHVCGKNAIVRKGQTQLQGAFKGSLRPSHDLMFFISPSVKVLIYQNGQIVLDATEQTQLSDMYVPFTTIKLHNMRTIPVDIEDVEEIVPKKSRTSKRSKK